MGNLSNLMSDQERTSAEPVTLDFDPIPAGNYVLAMKEQEVLENKKGTGSYLKAEFQVIEGEYAGRKIWFNFNVMHESAKTQQIGRGQLAALHLAVGGVGIPEDGALLLDKPFIGKVSVEPGSDGYKAGNSIKSFKKYDRNAATLERQSVQAEVNRAATLRKELEDDTPDFLK